MPNLEFRCIIRTTQLQSHNCLKRFGLKGSWKELHDESQSVHHPVFMDTGGGVPAKVQDLALVFADLQVCLGTLLKPRIPWGLLFPPANQQTGPTDQSGFLHSRMGL